MPLYRLNRLLKRIMPVALVVSVAIAPMASAMDTELRGVPRLPGSALVWEDKPIYVNGVTAAATHLRTDMAVEKIVAFYDGYFTKADWELDKGLVGLTIRLFKKKDKFFYVVIMGDGKYVPCDIYLINSPTDLVMCKDIKDYFFQDNLANDTSGRDLVGVPRYPNSKRRLNFFAPQEAALIMYEAEGKPSEIVRFYRKHFLDEGWLEDRVLSGQAMEDLAPELKDQTGLVLFYRGEDTIYINILAAPEDVRANPKLARRSMIIITKNVERELPFPGAEQAFIESEGGGEE